MASGDRTFCAVLDGMGGHAEGAQAAEVAVDSLRRSFETSGQAADPEAFLRGALEQAHREVVGIGDDLPAAARPRATVAVFLVDGDRATWGHVGDARVYHFRDGKVLSRTRDHTPVEQLVRDGLITEADIPGHPLRHYVEYCLGGFSELPDISVAELTPLEPGDVLLACSDGLWSGVDDEALAATAGDAADLDGWLARQAGRAIRATMPYSDNTTAIALRITED